MSFSSKDVCDILGEEARNILGNPFSEAVEGVQGTVELLVKRAGLPNEIAIRYKAFAGDESLLYSSESYRDHFFHPFHTFLLGFLLINKLNLSQKNKQPFPLNDDFLKKWLLTSLLHDITYTAEKGPSWLKDFIKKRLGFYIRAHQDWGSIFSDIDNTYAIEKLSFRFESKDEERRRIFRTWLNKQIEEWHDHGVLSAILLLRDAKEWKLSEEMMNECGLAIALHNYHKSLSGDRGFIEKKELKADVSLTHRLGSLTIRDYPLAFLLACCDTAQEWGRPSSKQTTHYSAYKDVEVHKNKKSIFILLNYNLDEFMKIKEKMGKTISSKDKAFSELVAEEREKFDKMKNTWKSDEWNYSIKLIALSEEQERYTATMELADIIR